MKSRIFFRLRWTTFGGVCLALSCSTSPTGRRQLAIVPDTQMNGMGVQAFDEYKSSKKIDTDPRRNEYVKCISYALLAVSQDQTGVKDWEVVVFKDETANAFALPGGKIGVHTGILPVAKNQHQLSAVIGHEIGHVIARHGNERVSEAMTAGLITSAAATTLGGEKNKDTWMAVLGLGANFGVLLPHSRGHESEADKIGQEFMSRAGFDPRQSIELWKNMQEASGGASPPEFMSTHPSNSTRIKALEDGLSSAMPLYEQARASGKTPNCQL